MAITSSQVAELVIFSHFSPGIDVCTSLINIIRLCHESAAASFYFFVPHMRECSQADSVLIWYMDPALTVELHYRNITFQMPQA